MTRWRKALAALGMLPLLLGVASCAIDPVPTPGLGDVYDNNTGSLDAKGQGDTRPAHADAAVGGCTCFDDQGREWSCDPSADACPCEPSTLVCPEGTEACEGVETPEVVEPAEVAGPSETVE